MSPAAAPAQEDVLVTEPQIAAPRRGPAGPFLPIQQETLSAGEGLGGPAFGHGTPAARLTYADGGLTAPARLLRRAGSRAAGALATPASAKVRFVPEVACAVPRPPA